MSSEKRQKIVRYLSNLNFEKNEIENNLINDIFTYSPISSDEIFSEKFKIIYIFYDEEDELFEQHKDFWNENIIPAFIAVHDKKSYIIDVKQKPNKKNPLTNTIGENFNYGVNSEKFPQKKMKELLKESIDNSYFWNFVKEQRKKVNEVDEDLLNNLVALHKELTKGNNNYEEINLLILQCLFVKYLEDRGIFKKKSQLINALEQSNDKELKKVFKKIKTINGDIFSNIEFTVNPEQLHELAIFFEHDYREYAKDQLSLFPYEFDKIPIELISNVYEEFLGETNKIIKKSQGVFYTRSFVVDFMLSHSVYKQIVTNKKITVLDPACGSGIFLVQSYKAILNQNPNISIDDKITILQKQIFGIDIDKRALQIAAFSLYLALLASCTEDEIKERIEKQKPMLPNLIGHNLLKKNTITDEIIFFVGKNKIESFDCIVGNPPWGQIKEIEFSFYNSMDILRENNIPESIINKLKSEKIKTDKFKKNLQKILDLEERKYIDKIIKYTRIETNEQVKERNIYKKEFKGLYNNVSRYQRSQCFLLRINQWCNENTTITFIVNNANFLNEDSMKFRKEIIQKFNILNYYDLSNITKILFKHANEPGSILIMDKKKNEENVIEYHTAQLTDMAKALKLIHCSSSDEKKIKQADLLKEGQDIIWKIFVNGNWDDYQLLKKKYFSKDLNISVECRSGFQPRKGMVCLGKPSYEKIIEPNDFEQYFILNELVEYNWNQNLRRRPNLNIFRDERLLIPLSPTDVDKNKIRGIYVEEEIIHKHNILSVKFKKNDKYIKNLNVFLGILNSKFIGYYLNLTSSQWKKGKRNTLRNSDIENLPFPNNISNNDQMKELTNLVKQIQNAKKENLPTKELEDQIDEKVFDLYGLLDFEKEIIREFYDVNVYRVKENKKVNSDDLQEYVDKFRDVFSFILDDDLALNAEYSIRNLGAFVSFSIVSNDKFVKKVKKSKLNILDIVKRSQLKESYLSKAIKEEKVKIYTEENFNIIKSKYFKDWTVRQAMKDANEEIGLVVKNLPNE